MPDPTRHQGSPHEVRRGSVLEIESYDIDIDLTRGAGTFVSRAEIRFRCKRPGISSFADLAADATVRRAALNGSYLSPLPACHPGHLPLPQLDEQNVLEVEAELGYAEAGAGLRRADDSDGSTCVYSKALPDGARHIYCCFDQEDLRAPFTLSLTAPVGWSSLANGPALGRPAGTPRGRWRFAATPPIAPYLLSFCAGPFRGLNFVHQRDTEPSLPVTVTAMPASATLIEAVRPALIRQPLRYYERVLGVPYPVAKCDVVFVPHYPPLAFGAPGLVTVQDRVLAQAARAEPGLYLAAVFAHELAHAWFGGLVDIRMPDYEGLIEGLTTYVSRNALTATQPGTDPWERSVEQGLPDQAYSDYAAPFRRLEGRIGRELVLDGLGQLIRDCMCRCITRGDLARCLSQVSGESLLEADFAVADRPR